MTRQRQRQQQADQIKKLASEPAAFRSSLLIDADGSPRRLGDCRDPWQAADFSALDGGWRRVVRHGSGHSNGNRDGGDNGGETQFQRAYLERPRGHSKTNDIAVSAAWALFASRRRLRGVVAAADKDQAGLNRDAIDGLVRLNPWLSKFLEVQREKVINVYTGSELLILSSDVAASYGLTPDFVICDELTHWSKPDLWHSLFSAAAKRSHCLLLIIANAGFQTSWQWPIREAIRQDSSWYFNRLEGPVASWITAERLAEQKRLLPAVAYARLWGNEWTSGSGDALSEGDIDRAIVLAGPAAQAEQGWCYIAGLDLSVSRDHSAFVVVAKHVGHSEHIPAEKTQLTDVQRALVNAGMMDEPDEPTGETIWHDGTGRVKLADVRLWRPQDGRGGKIDMAEIERTILALDGVFKFESIAYDPYQAAYLSQRLEAAGLPCEAVDFTGGNLKSMCSAVLEGFNEGRIDLYQHGQLIADLKALRVVEKSYGMRLESPRGSDGHGDAATGLAIALHVARRIRRPAGKPAVVDRPLVCWP